MVRGLSAAARPTQREGNETSFTARPGFVKDPCDVAGTRRVPAEVPAHGVCGLQ